MVYKKQGKSIPMKKSTKVVAEKVDEKSLTQVEAQT
jgi:hypothetical protein